MYTPQRKRQRQYLVKPQTYEIETRMYLEELRRKEEEALRAKAEQQNEDEENENRNDIKKYLIGNGGN